MRYSARHSQPGLRKIGIIGGTLHLATCRLHSPALRAEGPKWPRFDSPGRSRQSRRSPGYTETNGLQGPRGRDSWGALVQCVKWNYAPLGLLWMGGRLTQGSAALRPGLSNLAPVVAYSGMRSEKNQHTFCSKGNYILRSLRCGCRYAAVKALCHPSDSQ